MKFPVNNNTIWDTKLSYYFDDFKAAEKILYDKYDWWSIRNNAITYQTDVE